MLRIGNAIQGILRGVEVAVDSGCAKLRIFISSVQKELEQERDSASYAITENPTLDEYLEPVLYENLPASSSKALEECVALVARCQIYVLIVGQKAGFMLDRRSITHAEFQKARALHEAGRMALLVFRKKVDGPREKGATALLEEVGETGVKYKEFSSPKEFRQEFLAAIRKLLKSRLAPAEASLLEAASRGDIESISNFECERSSVPLADLDEAIARRMMAHWYGMPATGITRKDLTSYLLIRGHLIRNSAGALQPTRLGSIVLAKDATKDRSLTNATVMAEAFAGVSPAADPRDQQLITGPVTTVVRKALDFVSRNTRHPDRIVGVQRFTLDEYPQKAIREMLVNAIAHRSYEDIGSRIRLHVFSDRIVVSSPGLTPAPLTPRRLMSGEALPRSRNPLLAQSLYHLDLMENRGSGVRRIQTMCQTHGLKGFSIRAVDGHLEFTLFGPGEDIEALPLPAELLEKVLPTSRRENLNARQIDMAERLGRGETLTSRECEKLYDVTRETTSKDFKVLLDERVAERIGQGRATRYILAGLSRK